MKKTLLSIIAAATLSTGCEQIAKGLAQQPGRVIFADKINKQPYVLQWTDSELGSIGFQVSFVEKDTGYIIQASNYNNVKQIYVVKPGEKTKKYDFGLFGNASSEMETEAQKLYDNARSKIESERKRQRVDSAKSKLGLL